MIEGVCDERSLQPVIEGSVFQSFWVNFFSIVYGRVSDKLGETWVQAIHF